MPIKILLGRQQNLMEYYTAQNGYVIFGQDFLPLALDKSISN
jgi:hypothetical protein